jgi:putative transposase
MNQKKPGYVIRNQGAIHFVTFTVVNWIDLFTRQYYRDIIIENLKYCREHKGLNVHAFVIMSNHVHLILSSETGKLSDTIRDFKSYTSKLIVNGINEINESRSDWMLNHFRYKGFLNSRNDIFQIWTNDNHPEELFSIDFIKTKVIYIHENPVRAGLVELPHEYLYSSAKNYAGMPGIMNIDFLW